MHQMVRTTKIKIAGSSALAKPFRQFVSVRFGGWREQSGRQTDGHGGSINCFHLHMWKCAKTYLRGEFGKLSIVGSNDTLGITGWKYYCFPDVLWYLPSIRFCILYLLSDGNPQTWLVQRPTWGPFLCVFEIFTYKQMKNALCTPQVYSFGSILEGWFRTILGLRSFILISKCPHLAHLYALLVSSFHCSLVKSSSLSLPAWLHLRGENVHCR